MVQQALALDENIIWKKMSNYYKKNREITIKIMRNYYQKREREREIEITCPWIDVEPFLIVCEHLSSLSGFLELSWWL